MKIIVLAINDNVNDAFLKAALEQFAKAIGGSSNPVVITQDDLSINQNQKTDFEKMIENILVICGDPYNRTQFDMNFWTKFLNSMSRDDTRVIMNKIVDTCVNDTKAMSILRQLRAERLLDLCKLALGMIR